MKNRNFPTSAIACALPLLFLFSNVSFAAGGQYIVAKSGGDFTTISAALAKGSSCTNPVVIDIMPGTYNENIKLTGSNACTHLRGSGKDVTIIQGQNSTRVIDIGIQCAGCGTPGKLSISGVTVQGNGSQEGIWADYTTLTLTDSRVTNTTTATGTAYGTIIVRNCVLDKNQWGASATYGSMQIESSVISDNSAYGIVGSGVKYVVDNLIQRNGTGVFVSSSGSDANISGNTISNNKNDGLFLQSWGSLVIKNNKITNNTRFDVNADWSGNESVTLAFNVFDKPYLARTKSVYNAKSDGTPW